MGYPATGVLFFGVMMEIVLEESPARWNEELSRLQFRHVLQTAQWGDVKAFTGWQAERWAFRDGGRTAAAALVLTRRSVGGFLAVQYVPKGPALDYSNPALLDRVLAHLEQDARQHGALFVKIDPDVVVDSSLGMRVTAHLQTRGWLPSREQIQFPNTMVLDLAPDEEALLAAMKQKTRYNIRLAMRRGVVVRSGGHADLPTFYSLYSATAERDGFIIRPFSYYRRVWETFLDADLGHLLLAEVKGEPVAGVFLFRFADRAWYFYGASASRYRKLMPNYLLQWEAIRWAKVQGCSIYDLWGAPTELSESDPMWGVYRFKLGFGARLERHIGAWDYPVKPVMYRIYSTMMPRILDFMHWRARRFPG